MELFDKAAYSRFFNPLACRNKRVYYECILRLIEKSKEVSVLYENEARDTLIIYFRNLSYAVADENNSEKADENISSSKSASENAGAVLSYFRSCGWLAERELGRNGDNIAAVTPYCRKMIEAIERIFNRDSSAALTNHIFAIYDILHSAFIVDHGRTIRPYSNILVPIVDNVADLKNELLILKDSIRTIMKMVIKMTETNDLGQFLLKDKLMEDFFKDYFFIKKDGLIPGYIDEIEKMLRQIVKLGVYENMIQEYVKLKKQDERTAREVIEGQLAEVKSFISYEYVKEMDYIDKKINSYYLLYATRIMMVLSNNTNLQTYLNDLLLKIKALPLEARQTVLQAVAECFRLQSHKYVGRKSIERRKKRQPNTKSAVIINSNLSAEEKARLTQELLYEYPDRYGVKQAAAYFERLLGASDSLIPSQATITSRTDAMMIAASIIYSGTAEFPFVVEFLDGTIETEVARLSNIRIMRKNK